MVTSLQELECHGRVWKTFKHTNVARFHGLAFNFGLMPALILDFYPNGNINEFVKTKSLTDDCKFNLVPPVVNVTP